MSGFVVEIAKAINFDATILVPYIREISKTKQTPIAATHNQLSFSVLLN